MTFDVEIMLRQNDRVFTEQLSHPREAAEWSDIDVDAVLKSILQAIDRVLDPEGTGGRTVNLRGLSWIVSPYKDGVVLAFEIHSASAVAGPFAIRQDALEGMITRVMHAGPPSPTVH